jgi:hypothetical protein
VSPRQEARQAERAATLAKARVADPVKVAAVVLGPVRVEVGSLEPGTWFVFRRDNGDDLRGYVEHQSSGTTTIFQKSGTFLTSEPRCTVCKTVTVEVEEGPLADR